MFAELYGKFFTDEQEPQSWDTNFGNMYKNYFNGETLPVKPLNYFYNKEKNSRKGLRQLDSIQSFIEDDPHIGNKNLFFDVRKDKVKIITLTNLLNKENNKDLPKAIKEPEKKRTNRKKKDKTIKMIKVRRV